MKEDQPNPLRDALGRLSTYQPKAELWDQIADQLPESIPEEENREELHSALQRLTHYRAPEQIWQKIEAGLSRRSPFSTRWNWAIAASLSFLLLAGGAWVWLANVSTPDFPSVISEKRINDQINLSEAEVAAYETVLEQELQQLTACLEDLSSEEKEVAQGSLLMLEAMRQTRDSLGLLLNQADPRLAEASKIQLADLEIQQTELVRNMRKQVCGTPVRR
jgi:hypothetical protein